MDLDEKEKPHLECKWNPKRYKVIDCEFNRYLIDRCRKLENVMKAADLYARINPGGELDLALKELADE